AVERMAGQLAQHCGQEPVCIMTGGAGWKMLPFMTRPFELVESLIFDGLLVTAQTRAARG
ncbi:MAG: type III pantothenate kinase, partial [Burkholderiaceae bacterium]|nr:type III pantothenate kinase [Burkholderiaceae bacterium]